MRALTIVVLVVLVELACGEQPAVPVRELVRATPAFAPVVGGTLIELEGGGFSPGDRVLVAGRESVFVDVRDATRVAFVVPPGDHPGDAELVVFGSTGAATARGLLHYSSAPTITEVSPIDVALTASQRAVTVRGAGFADEGAGEPLVLVDGKPVADVTVIDDSTLSFVAPSGRAFSRPTIDVVNARGRAARERAFRYVPSATPGLFLFSRFGPSFAVFYDPATGTTLPIPSITGVRFTSVVRDEQGAYWGVDTSSRYGRIDLETQTLMSPARINVRLPALTRHAGQLYGLARYWQTGGRFGSVDASGQFAPIGTTALTCCGSYGVASDGTTVWLTSRQDGATIQIRSVDPMTGTMSAPVVLAGGSTYHVEELRWWGGALYAATATPSAKIVRIDPQTGAVVEVLDIAERVSAIAPYDVAQ